MRIARISKVLTVYVTCIAHVVAMGVPNAWANPEGGVVVGGAASIAAEGNTTTITQTSDRAAINWNSFDIKAGETTEFKQPNQNSVALNRVTGSEQRASQIAGNLNANGKVILINPNGILFDKTAKVDVSGLVASTADITNENFMAGRGNFDIKSPNSNASIINNGTVSLKDKGLAAFVAPSVVNNGIITAKMGKIEIGGAETFTVDLYGDGLLSLAVSDKLLNTLIANRGAILNEGGTITLTATAAAKILDEVTGVDRSGSPLVISEGIIEAGTGEREGKIKILATDSTGKNTAGTVAISGIVSAAAPSSSSSSPTPKPDTRTPRKGGTIQISGKNTFITNALIDVSGMDGGGRLRLGGEYLGGTTTEPVKGLFVENLGTPNAQNTFVDRNVSLLGNAIERGDGGHLVTWADGNTGFYGRVEAKGGIGFGVSGTADGGFVEISGKGYLDMQGEADLTPQYVSSTPDTRYPTPKKGTLLLDPTDIVISNFAPNDSSVAANLKLWLDASDATTVTLSYSTDGLGTTASATAGTNTITTAANVSANLAVGARIRLTSAGVTTTANTLGTDTYTIAAIAGTTITTVETIAAGGYSGQTLYRGLVSQWNDKSGLATPNNATQTIDARKPLWIAGNGGQNGNGLMQFNGGQFFNGANLTAGDRSVSILFKGSAGEFFGTGRNGANPGSFAFAPTYLTGWTNAVVNSVLAIGVSNQFSIRGADFTSTYTNLYNNSALAVNSTNLYTLSTGSVAIGSRNFAVGFAVGTIANIFYYSDDLSTTSRNLLEQYQSAKWGIALTPSGTGATEADKAMASDGYSVFHKGYLERLSQSANIALVATNSITINDLTANGGDGILNLSTSGRTLSLSAGAGGITMANTANTLRTNGGAMTFTTSSGGGITLGNLDTTGNGVTPVGASISISGGAIIGAGLLTGSTVTLSGTTLGTSGTRLQTSAGTLNITASGSSYVTETDAVTLGVTSTGGVFDFLSNTGTVTLGASSFAGNALVKSTGALTTTGAVTPAGWLGLWAAGGDLTIGGAVSASTTSDWNFLSGSNVRFNASVQQGSSGGVNVVSGWDGSTGSFSLGSFTMGSVLGNTASYGVGSGSVFVNTSSNAAAVGVGSFSGATSVAGSGLTVASGTGAGGRYGQLGYVAGGASGNIVVNANANILLPAATFGASSMYTKIGHGNNSGGTITITAQDITLSTSSFGNNASIGHGTYGGAYSTKTGNIIITARDIALTSNYAWGTHAMIGHYTSNNGDITVSARNITISSPINSVNVNWAKIGNGTDSTAGNFSGNITVNASGNITLNAAGSQGAQIGNGNGAGTRTGNIIVTAAGELSLVSTGSGAAFIGHSTSTASGISNANIRIGANALDFSSSVTGTFNLNNAAFMTLVQNALAGGSVIIASTNAPIVLSNAFTGIGSNAVTLLGTNDITINNTLTHSSGTLNIVSGWDGSSGLNSDGSFTLANVTRTGNRNLSLGGAVSVTNGNFLSSGNLTLASGASVAGVGAATPLVLAAAGNFINNSGSATPISVTGGGRYLVYSTSPLLDTLGTPAITRPNKRYNFSYGTSTAGLFSGASGFLYSVSPTLTVTADAQSKIYGQVNPPLTYSVSGLIDGDTAGTALTGALATTATQYSNVAAYAITQGSVGLSATATTLGYTLSGYTPANLTITQAPLILNPTAQTYTYDGTNGQFTNAFSLAGCVGSDNCTSYTGLAGFGGSATVTAADKINAGTRNITSSGSLAFTNYSVSYATNTNGLTISQAALTLNPTAQTYTYDGTNGQFVTSAYTLTGFVNSETAAVVSGAGSVTAADKINAGMRNITGSVGTLSASNYNFSAGTNTNGLVINQAVINLSGSKVYDGLTSFANTTFGTAGTINTGVNGETLVLSGSGSVPSSTVLAGTQTLTLGTLTLGNGTGLASDYTLTSGTHTGVITARPVTVTADSGLTKVYGNSDPASYTYTTSSLGSGIALSGALTRVAGEPVNTYNITPGTLTTANNSNYTITYVGDVFSVTPRPVTVTADASQSKIYGNADPSSYTYTTSSLGGVALSGVLARVAGEYVNTYDITQGTLTTANNSNYTITYVGDVFSITPRPVTVTATNTSKIYGAADPALAYSVTQGNLVNSDSFSGALTRATGENAGSYAITQNTLNNSNYTITFVDGAFTINKAVLTVAVNAASKIYGDANPAFSVAYSGFQYADSATNLMTQPLVTTAAGQYSPVGSYTITASGGVSDNYTFAYTDGAFTITSRALTLRPDSVTRLFGTSNPSSYSYTVVGGNVVNNDTLGVASYTVPWTNTTPIGTLSYTMSGLSNANYSYTYQAGDFIINAGFSSDVDVSRIMNGAALRNPIFAYTLLMSATEDMKNPTKNLRPRSGITDLSAPPLYTIDRSFDEPTYRLEYKDGWLRHVSLVKDTSSGSGTTFAATPNPQQRQKSSLDDISKDPLTLYTDCKNVGENTACSQMGK